MLKLIELTVDLSQQTSSLARVTHWLYQTVSADAVNWRTLRILGVSVGTGFILFDNPQSD